MSFKIIVTIGAMLIIAAAVLFLPGILRGIKTNPQIEDMLKHPDGTYSFFSKCKKHVSDVNRCYNAYSASVQIADSKDCSPSGIALKLKFKELVEHTTEIDIESEISKECPSYK
ncbi:hypothetical protein [Citrobacter koseri]|uniref:hypothetical protein n=1 Tax=Citrobacter koseri TaxID=545 RepID=UPI0019068F9D|nr:hypothetical protein [Citrobacter koseri]MBJ8867649.1 hypothetical protein [Citrobacter koseri]MBL4565621.1 hypothetical protein [Citrobacter koseri]HCT9899538.1 hypothetical protein [Citrobacter koseri]HEM6718261.1 hypothetical protein [Citrobacter koseri]